MSDQTEQVPTRAVVSVRYESYERIKRHAEAQGVSLTAVIDWAIDAFEAHDPRAQIAKPEVSQ